MRHEESKIQADIVALLELRQVFCHSVPNERASSARDMVRLKRQGLVPGVADLVVWVPYPEGIRIEYWEVKTQKGKQSTSQKVFEDRCKMVGYKYRIVRSLDEVLEILEAVPLPSPYNPL